jgi:hypothetical protein
LAANLQIRTVHHQIFALNRQTFRILNVDLGADQ